MAVASYTNEDNDRHLNGWARRWQRGSRVIAQVEALIPEKRTRDDDGGGMRERSAQRWEVFL